MVAALRLIALALLPSLSLACGVPLSWTNPTSRTDGTSLTNLASINIYRAATVAGLATAPKLATVAAPATTYTDTSCANSTAYAYAVTAVDANGLESAQTTAVTVTTPPQAKPNPPSNLTVGTMTAYTFEKQQDRLAFLAVGTVPLGTQCDTTQPVGPYFVVPRSAVSWIGNVQPPVVVAQCG